MEHQNSIPKPEYKDELEIIQNHIKFSNAGTPNIPEWQTFPEIPTAQDLNPDWDDPEDLERVNSLLPNDWQHPFLDKNTYLETHYRLQREEAIAMLRFSVKKYREDPTMGDDDETCIYTKVFIRGYLLTRLGPMCRVQFSTEKAGKKIRWQQTRRLTTGSLVAISTSEDGFRTICMPAVIADHPIRDGLDQIPPTIQLLWANTDDAVLDPTIELVMLEARSGYFEAIRHCLVGLQHVAATPTPLDKYLVSLDKSDTTAQYVLDNPRMNIGSLIHHIPGSSTLPTETITQRLSEARESLRNYHVLDGINDQISPYTNLDNSQLSAVHRILTKELSIIQGPPGTGKTFTSVQAIQILLDSQQERGKNVIIVAAQTNHAVDQILIQLIKLGFNTVRLGGRTQNEDIKRYNMYNLRRRTMPPRAHMADRDYRTLEAARKKNIARIEEIVGSVFTEELIDPQALQDAGIISQKQFDSLQASDGWTHAPSGEGPSDLLSQWLGDQRIEATLMDSFDPDFNMQESDDTVDLDAEDYDIELDDCIADDDEDRGRVEGRWMPIKYHWTGVNPRQYTEVDLVIRQELKNDNLWNIHKQYRGAIYQYWQRELLNLWRDVFRAELAANARICRNLKANKWHRDLRCVKTAQIEIVGCTTTGLCKYRGLLAALQPRTMLIEEAAETKEASILSALYPSLQQLILVGDHQQLAPSCDTPFLDEAPYFIRVSMFERLVKLDMPYTMLNMQRRMHPILREILNPFYPALQDHPVVSKPNARLPVPGMSQQSFFFHHTWSEGTDENLSKFNILEAEMVVKFIDYLKMNGVKETEITVLTFYRGQRKKILGEFRKMQHREPFKNVHTVDSYQGEENDIVILSLVRSNGPNGPHRAGFLQDSNRGVVSISRARRGFYIFGNMINLLNACEDSRILWGQVQNIFQRQNRFGYDGRLPITCQQHNRTTFITHPDDWINHHGGCTEPCEEQLECGHNCDRRCHWVRHDRLICMKPCERVLSCGHRCQKICGDGCQCTCAAFTGAYPNDEAWDDEAVVSGLRQVSTIPISSGAPFIGNDGRIGRLRGSRYQLRDRRSGQVGARDSSVRSSTSGQAWINFDARQHDIQRQEEHRQSIEVGSPNPLRQNALSTVNRIRETFRPVTLNTRGMRNVEEGIISETSGTLLHAKVESPGNHNTPRRVQRTGDLLKFDDALLRENLPLDPTTPHRLPTHSAPYSNGGEQPNARCPRHLSVPNGLSPFGYSSHITYTQQHSATVAAQQTLRPLPVNQARSTRDAGRVHGVEDRPEWEDSQSICETYDANSNSRHAINESEGDLIDL
ncbi:hypothetical protein O1611_g7120 [Lasiodiplodia mahajangana]|uniref:Uncharacterized protein n=1 Tax=Lasiodiplodia mahajangana TaxID=1108764 RepID=A0ACC2JG93_9PEZI|nr:hypothetical protein O1611_g7120 [Lasiodiplodia mahajangana]